MHQPQNDHSWHWPHLTCNNSDIVHQCPRTSRVGMSIFTARGCRRFAEFLYVFSLQHWDVPVSHSSATSAPTLSACLVLEIILYNSPAASCSHGAYASLRGMTSGKTCQKKHKQAWFLNSLDMSCVNLMSNCFTACLLVVHLTIPILIDSHDTVASRGVPQLPLISKQVQVHVDDLGNSGNIYPTCS